LLIYQKMLKLYIKTTGEDKAAQILADLIETAKVERDLSLKKERMSETIRGDDQDVQSLD
jgi:hypothetical protein